MTTEPDEKAHALAHIADLLAHLPDEERELVLDELDPVGDEEALDAIADEALAEDNADPANTIPHSDVMREFERLAEKHERESRIQ